jgi:hypothetical protein
MTHIIEFLITKAQSFEQNVNKLIKTRNPVRIKVCAFCSEYDLPQVTRRAGIIATSEGIND